MSLADDVLRHLEAHRSVRAFTADPVPDTDVERCVHAAQRASTSSNIQAYSLLQVTDADERARLVELTGGQPYVAEAGAFFCVCADLRRLGVASELAGRERVENLETFLLATIDASLFAQNLALAFEALGYGICFIGGLRNELPEVDALLEIPHGVMPLFGMCVGRPASDPGQRPRLEPGAVLHRGRFRDAASERAAIEAYDGRMTAYYEGRGKSGWNWSSGIARKFARPLRGHLAGYYASKGARLD